MLVDFSASWCGACGELDRHTFSSPEVVREGRRFVTVRVDLSPGKDTPEKRQYLQRYAQRGLPLVVLHRGNGQEASRVTGFVEPDEFVSLLRGVN
jgi:thiol:disulfide interchange protein DsbD